MTERARQDLSINTDTVPLIFSARAIIEDMVKREHFFRVIEI